jgi:hypothetical protein
MVSWGFLKSASKELGGTSFTRESAGVMEWWSNGVMQELYKIESCGFGFSNTPILQKRWTFLPAKRLKLDLGQRTRFFY